MKKKHIYLLICTLVLMTTGIVFSLSKVSATHIDASTLIDRLPKISPDYSGTVFPPNIAPLNFQIHEKGQTYWVVLSSQGGSTIEIKSKSPKITIPEKKWHALLDKSRGQDLVVDVYLKDINNNWKRFQSIVNHVAEEKIDPYVVYRKIHPSHNTWRAMGLYQRNMTNFDESPVLKNDKYKWGCAHCHNFNNNLPNKIAIGVRSGDYKSCVLIVDSDEKKQNQVYKLNKKFGFTSWHPSGKFALPTLNRTKNLLFCIQAKMKCEIL